MEGALTDKESVKEVGNPAHDNHLRDVHGHLFFHAVHHAFHSRWVRERIRRCLRSCIWVSWAVLQKSAILKGR